jgi:flavodoxin
MKKLLVYYSLDGNTRFIAGKIAAAIGADQLELKPKKELQAKGLMKYLWGGRQVVHKETPELEAFELDPSGYDMLILGTPVWAFTYAPAMRSFLVNYKSAGKKVAIFCCSGGGLGKTLAAMREALAGNEVMGEIAFIEPLQKKQEEQAAQAVAWAKSIIEQAERP